MNSDSEALLPALEAALQRLAQHQSDELAHQLRPILLTNLDRGRIQTFTAGRSDQIPAYLESVASNFTTLHTLIHQLQIERSPEAWTPLYERMQTWAYNFFLRKNFTAGDHTLELAAECAAEAAAALLTAYFPYDTDFDPWAHILVQNSCRKYIQKSLQKSVVPEDKKIELNDDLIDPPEPLPEWQTLQKELGTQLDEAISQLPELRRAVIQMLYFDELEPAEIAQKLGKSLGAVYSLHFNALADLRKILSTTMDNLHE